ncbi:hypothetical protein BT69DRAFT_1285785 [Atractiella rhizophila]|nr:hypothetical protein BT69DRAFT_1285785 [Atractiella rhizophila]
MSNRRIGGISGIARQTSASTIQIRTFKYQAPPTPLEKITPLPPRHKRPTLSPTIPQSDLPPVYFPYDEKRALLRRLPSSRSQEQEGRKRVPRSLARGLRRREERERRSEWRDVVEGIERDVSQLPEGKVGDGVPQRPLSVSASKALQGGEAPSHQQHLEESNVYSPEDFLAEAEEVEAQTQAEVGEAEEGDGMSVPPTPRGSRYFSPPHTHQHAFLQRLVSPLTIPPLYVPKILDHKSLSLALRRMDGRELAEYRKERRTHARSKFATEEERRKFFGPLGIGLGGAKEGENNSQLQWIGRQTLRFQISSLVSDLHRDYASHGRPFWNGFMDKLKEQGRWEDRENIEERKDPKKIPDPGLVVLEPEYEYDLPNGMRLDSPLLDYLTETTFLGHRVGLQEWNLTENDVMGWVAVKAPNDQFRGEKRVAGTTVEALIGGLTHIYGLRTSSKFVVSRIIPLLNLPLALSLSNSSYTAWGRESRLMLNEPTDDEEWSMSRKRLTMARLAKRVPEALDHYSADRRGKMKREYVFEGVEGRPDRDTRIDKNLYLFAKAWITQRANEAMDLGKDLPKGVELNPNLNGHAKSEVREEGHVESVLRQMEKEDQRKAGRPQRVVWDKEVGRKEKAKPSS